MEAAAAKVDTAAEAVKSASLTATTAAGVVKDAAAVATTAAAEVQKASETAKVASGEVHAAAGEVKKAGEDAAAGVKKVGDQLEGRFKKVEDAAAGAQGLASQAANAANDARTIIESVRTELGARGKTQSTYDQIVQLQTLLSAVQAAVAKIPETVNNPETRKAEALKAEELQASVQEVNKLLKKISGEGGANLDALSQSVAATSTEVGDVKDKVERLKKLLEMIREVGEKVLDRTPQKKAPVKTWFEPGGAAR